MSFLIYYFNAKVSEEEKKGIIKAFFELTPCDIAVGHLEIFEL